MVSKKIFHRQYTGSGGIDAERVGNDPLAYMAAIEPFHDNVISVYVKSTKNSLKTIQGKRYILDVYGYPNENGEGPAHYIVCGPSPNKDVYFYKTNDLTHGLFAKWKVSDDAAARIAIADFDYDNVLSFATISYSVPGYYRSANPTINVFYNRLTQRKLRTNKEIQGIKQNHDLLFKVPRPNQALKHQTVAFITINGIILSLDIVPPYSSRHANNTTYIKVLSSRIMWIDSSTELHQLVNHSCAFLCKKKSISPLAIHSDNNRIKTGSEEAL
ncbi:unnamed protein product [Rotaria magnacalcarata]|uniref:Uncharacterized protein n=2 Tax=Rotaria magnacalcarata TaxID=392030 RepID=A0A816FSA3_9BILA|nr:unnamed protein product [Rotaria magnacalcarata]